MEVVILTVIHTARITDQSIDSRRTHELRIHARTVLIHPRQREPDCAGGIVLVPPVRRVRRTRQIQIVVIAQEAHLAGGVDVQCEARCRGQDVVPDIDPRRIGQDPDRIAHRLVHGVVQQQERAAVAVGPAVHLDARHAVPVHHVVAHLAAVVPARRDPDPVTIHLVPAHHLGLREDPRVGVVVHTVVLDHPADVIPQDPVVVPVRHVPVRQPRIRTHMQTRGVQRRLVVHRVVQQLRVVLRPQARLRVVVRNVVAQHRHQTVVPVGTQQPHRVPVRQVAIGHRAVTVHHDPRPVRVHRIRRRR